MIVRDTNQLYSQKYVCKTKWWGRTAQLRNTSTICQTESELIRGQPVFLQNPNFCE